MMKPTENTKRALVGLLTGAGAAWLAWELGSQPAASRREPAADAVDDAPELAQETVQREGRRRSGEDPVHGQTREPAETSEAQAGRRRLEPLLDVDEFELEPVPEFTRRRAARAPSPPSPPSRQVGILASGERDAAGCEASGTEPLALIADDDADIRTLAAQMLERAGFEVVTAADGDEALRLAIDREPTVCVLDWMMPRRSGLDVLESLRSGAQTRSTPVLMLTARAGTSDVERGLSAGADAYLTKPFTADQLRERVLELVDLRAA